MTITEILRQGFHYARTCKSLWLFGFFVGMAGGGSTGGGSGGGDGAGGLSLSPAQFAVIAIAAVLAVGALIVMQFVSEGALIEGVVRARQGRAMSTREGFRAG